MSESNSVLIIVIDAVGTDIEAALLRIVQQYASQANEVAFVRARDLMNVPIDPNRNTLDDQRMQFYKALTPRQQQVVRGTASGLSNKEIAAQMGIVSGVVAAHLTDIYEFMRGIADTYPANRTGLLYFLGDFFVHHPDLV